MSTLSPHNFCRTFMMYAWRASALQERSHRYGRGRVRVCSPTTATCARPQGPASNGPRLSTSCFWSQAYSPRSLEQVDGGDAQFHVRATCAAAALLYLRNQGRCFSNVHSLTRGDSICDCLLVMSLTTVPVVLWVHTSTSACLRSRMQDPSAATRASPLPRHPDAQLLHAPFRRKPTCGVL